MAGQNFNQPGVNQSSPNNSSTPLTIAKPKLLKKILIATTILNVFIILLVFLFYERQKQTSPSINKKGVISKETTTPTIFAEYKPYIITITPRADSYSLPLNWDKIENREQFFLDNETKKKLEKQGFVALATNYHQIYSLYQDNTENNRPNFITIDSLLHTFHILYDYTLRYLEINKFTPDLKNLTKIMLQKSLEQYNQTNQTKLKIAAKKNVAYFAVALKLLEPEAVIPPLVNDLVEKELALIASHSDFQSSPIFEYKEDYSQYIPRGHYTRNEDFKRYFKTMMWYGRMNFRIEPPEGTVKQSPKEKGREETRRALLISLILNQAEINQEKALKVWERIYQPTAFFVGKTDDLNVYDYLKTAKKVFGENLTLKSLGDDKKIDQVIAELKDLPGPKIFSSFFWETEDPSKTSKGFRFMGQRFVPDAYIFQQLVFKEVEDYTGDEPKAFTAETILTIEGERTVRAFPRGLDIAGVLGSQRAKEILDREKDSAFINYNEQFQKLKDEFSSLPPSQWKENLYWNWLYSLLPTLSKKGNGYPIFMQQPAWQDKDLNSFLGSWAELKHDTLLYSKQPYIPMAGGGLPETPKPKDRGYVEPNVEVYARLASLAKFMKEGLDSRNLLNQEYKNKLIKMEKTLLTLKEISEKELTNNDLGKKDYDFIKEIGWILEDLTTFSNTEEKKITSQTDEKMEVVADVYTEGNTKKVLEEGVGKPMNLLVVVKEGGDLYLTSGPIFSYYEFKQPMSDRLTDEKWQNMTKPPLLDFTQSFTVRKSD